jgi:phenylpropionate dioxygenase-like ring-hydroxylating dioxygenase large terminal subunit
MGSGAAILNSKMSLWAGGPQSRRHSQSRAAIDAPANLAYRLAERARVPRSGGRQSMISQEHNDLLTRIGPETPAGRLMRMYWQPVALADEFDQMRPVKAVRLLGEDFVVFRDADGGYGLMDRDCPHRGADLAFGRLEDRGLRCVFHGWLLGRDGQCLETPAEPRNSPLCRNVRQRAFPVVEKGGIVWGYFGDGAPPAFPGIDCFIAPGEYSFAFKGYIDCNWLQALEVGIDPAHASFLHRFFEDEDASRAYGRPFRDTSANSELAITHIMREFDRPVINVARTDYGMRLITLREIDPQRTHVRVTNQLFPHAFVIPLSQDMTISQWHVPVDDTACYWYAIFTSFTAPVDKERMRRQRLELYEPPHYKSRRNKSNDYGFDPCEQAKKTYTGMGYDVNVHDQWAVESMGGIQNRTREHLGASDKAIIQYRRILKEQIDKVSAGDKPLLFLDSAGARGIQGPATMDGVGPTQGWETYWIEVDAKRRRNAPWASPPPA